MTLEDKKIEQAVKREFRKYFDNMQNYRAEMNEATEQHKLAFQRLNVIEVMINAHAIGVQNVYDKCAEIEKMLNVDEVKKYEAALERVNLNKIKDDINNINKYMASSAVIETIKSFRSFKQGIMELLGASLKE